LKSDGTVVACGLNFDKQCDLEGFNDIKMISAGQTHTLGLKKDGTVVCAGSFLMGQADVGDWKDVIYISAGNCFSQKRSVCSGRSIISATSRTE
jgi:alpha-tubulin suppressor-like RCC1 family protein